MKILDGRALAAQIKSQLKEEVAKLGKIPGLAAVLVGNNEASTLYVGLKEKACQETGIYFEKLVFDADIPQKKLIKEIKKLNKRDKIHGILVQIPLPKNLDENAIIAAIDPKKDVDGFHSKNLSLLQQENPYIIPGVALGIFELIKNSGIDLKNKKTALLVNSEIFATPIKYLLEKSGSIVEIIIKPTKIKKSVSMADILIVALGKPKVITETMVKPGAVVIDVGTNKVNGKLVGDVDFENVKNKVLAITPVPGGVGPMTVAMLLFNTIKLVKQN